MWEEECKKHGFRCWKKAGKNGNPKNNRKNVGEKLYNFSLVRRKSQVY